MIIKNDKQVKLEFGTGDICIAGGYGENEDCKVGIVLFKDQEPRNVGDVGDIKQGEINLEDYPVVMTFSKKESIDVLIKELEEAKSFMY